MIAGVFLASCGGDSDEDSVAISLPVIMLACESFGGKPTEEVVDHFNSREGCARVPDAENPDFAAGGLSRYECADGTFIYWNEVGWGASNGTWIATGDGPPDHC